MPGWGLSVVGLMEGLYEAISLENKQIPVFLSFWGDGGIFDGRHFQSSGWKGRILAVNTLGFG